MRTFVVIRADALKQVSRILKNDLLTRSLGELPPSDELVIEVIPDKYNFFPLNCVPLDEQVRESFKGRSKHGTIPSEFIGRTIVQL